MRVMFRVWTALAVGCLLVMAAAGVSAQRRGGDPKAAAVKNPVPSTPASIKAGLTAYNMNCRHCHGLRGKGDGPLAPKNPAPADLTDAKWDHGSSDGEIFAIIMNGAPAPMTEMKGMKGTLQDRDVWNIVNYIRSVGPKPAATK
jgi:mono/diheme cytochrome c family protein